MLLTRRKVLIICFITLFFVVSACVNAYAVQIYRASLTCDSEKGGDGDGVCDFAMCVPPDNDRSEKNEKLESSPDLYIRFNKTDSMIFGGFDLQTDYRGVCDSFEKGINQFVCRGNIHKIVLRC